MNVSSAGYRVRRATSLKWSPLLLPVLVACLMTNKAQGSEGRAAFVAHPVGPALGQWTLGLGAGVDILPRRLVEAEWRHVPHAWLRSRVGLGRHVYLSQRANVVILDNQLQLGLGWGYALGEFAFGIHDHFGINWGTLGVEGFDATRWAFEHNPGLSVEYPLRRVITTLTVETLILHARHVTVGEASLTQKRTSVQGVSAGVTFESPLHNNSVVFYGFAVIYAKPDYQLWLAFSDAEQLQIYPRFFAGYAF